MTKIKSIHVQNFKAITEVDFDFNGASAIITAGNNKGKTSALRGLIDRFQSEKPDIIVKNGEEKGESVMYLTDGSKIEWRFTQKSETFSYTTADNIKMTTGVLSAIGEKYFGNKFNIDKFIQSSQKDQAKQVQSLLGIDLDDLENQHKEIYNQRTAANREVKRLKALAKVKPEKVDAPDIDSLRKKKEEIKEINQELKTQWEINNKNHQRDVLDFNEAQNKQKDAIAFIESAKIDLGKYKNSLVDSFIKFSEIDNYLQSIPLPEPLKEVTSLPEPEYHSFDEIDQQIEQAFAQQAKVSSYERELNEYNDWVTEGKKAVEETERLNSLLESINQEKMVRIKEANLPSEFEFSEEGLLYNGLPVNNNQISSSAKYICALKLGYLALGKLRTLHFDASFLDNNSLKEVQEWADSKDLQLLIERPSLEGGDITYQIIES